ncbi:MULTISPECIES: hypothetical protein [unclassified Caballeronia]|uniref:hypothetical protein n=1 Tax=unclassified Caballeronia TaxID=2646786 RepID=UPI002864F569|nr:MULTISPECIES: hypothetical protein [unclassified Caballeronia]MDR5749861.1 hypothetical protein [Caballeronia sp. LZ024]MDR5843011.1 hypothetical protein [Caballeronia sp. LZ031]
MAEFLHADRQRDDALFDAAVIRVDQLPALAGLLSLEEVAEQFAGLTVAGKIAIFGPFEDALTDVRATLTQHSTQPIS